MTESAYNDAMTKVSELTVAELDEELEQTARTSETCEMRLCCYLAGMRQRQGFRDFGYSNIYDYAEARFGFKSRKTRYLISLGYRLEKLPKLREALASGKLGWCKASRVARVAEPEDEAMWVESALALTVKDLERRIHDGTDSLTSELHFRVNEDVRILWENTLEIYRREAGAEISPSQAFEYMVAETFAQYGHVDNRHDAPSTEDASDEAGEVDVEASSDDAPPFPWAEPIDTSIVEQPSLWASEGDAETIFATSSDYNEVRGLVLQRDGWQCSYPGCCVRRNLDVHHIRFRSRGGPDEPWNLTVVCRFHHSLIHTRQIAVKGHAPLTLEWTPPKLMREVLERRRNNPSKWTGELDIKEWTLDPAPVVS